MVIPLLRQLTTKPPGHIDQQTDYTNWKLEG